MQMHAWFLVFKGKAREFLTQWRPTHLLGNSLLKIEAVWFQLRLFSYS